MLFNLATTATTERSFSTARRIKTWIRSRMLAERLNPLAMRMLAERLNPLAILHTHKTFTDSLDFIDIANDFISKSD